MLLRAKQSLRNEAGHLMVTTLVGSLVTLFVVGAIAAGILGLALFQKVIIDKADVTKEAAIADSTLRSDILWASSITPVNQYKVELTVPGQNGRCRIATWSIAPGTESTTIVDVIVVSYPATDATVNPVRCSGAPSEPSTQTIITDADPASTFTYTNAGGRPLTFTGGTAALAGPATPPAGVTEKAWASTRLAAVALDTAVASSTDRKAAYRFAQTADNLSVVQDATDAPSHFVPEGNLTALP